MAIAKVATALQEKTELVKRRSGSTGSSARVSTQTKATRATKPIANRPRIVVEVHG